MRWILLACSTALAFAQGTEPKPKAADYDVSAKADQIDIGAEFMVHSFSGEGQTYIAENFLIVEVALYPTGKDEVFKVNPGAFSLRVNGKKPALLPLTPQTFAASLNKRSGSPFGLSLPGIGGMGGPSQGPGTQGGPFPRPRTPDAGPPGGNDRPEAPKAEEVAVKSALPEGESKRPVSGFLYFAYRGKISGIKSLELVYERAVLKLR